MSNSKEPRVSGRRPAGTLHTPAPRQKLRSRRDSSSAPTYAPRRTQAERSEATRKQLLEAAAKLIRQNGFGGLRTIEVASVAGVSRGALMHHFPSKHALVVAVLNYVNELNFAQSTRRAQLARGSDDPIEEIVKDAQEFFFGDYFFIELAIAMSDESTRRLRRETHQFTRQTRFSIEAAWLDTLIASGIPKQLASDVLALTLSAVRGFSVRMLIEKDPEQFTRLMNVWRDIIRQHLARSLSNKSRKQGRKS
ncbi:TetR/AcrR family transcriptional regulator [Bradyrhizobium sp. 186]|uniref:TetR/AcrR family transcriptional regulator n=1 Tax=Bradyrhizobium sp. 186 TaxID=2782654 RepID=UPI0020012E20|nr:TetR/AcrR family transcriptional regulator [Bradyrhizobium sp. 186]UPK32684.1 TetR/AcrR family transcriptional regulator [Bradyrhizobium sp. 186]